MINSHIHFFWEIYYIRSGDVMCPNKVSCLLNFPSDLNSIRINLNKKPIAFILNLLCLHGLL